MPKKQKLPLLAHRGFSAKYPENTLMAFRKAIQSGADGIECDLQKTKDQIFVILHDDTIDRTSNGKGRIEDLTWDEIKGFDFGQGETIPTLDALLTELPASAWLNLEIKEGSVKKTDLPAIESLLAKKRAPKLTMISSFDHDFLPYFRKRGWIIGALLGEEHQHLGAWGLIKRLMKTRPHYVNLPIQAFERMNDRWVERILKVFRFLGFKICFWTINQEAHFKRVA